MLAFLGLVWKVYNLIANWYGPGPSRQKKYSIKTQLKYYGQYLLIMRARFQPDNLRILTAIARQLASLEVSNSENSDVYFYVKGHDPKGKQMTEPLGELSNLQIKSTFRPDVAFVLKKFSSRYGLKIFSNTPISEELLVKVLGREIEYSNKSHYLPSPRAKSLKQSITDKFVVDERGMRFRPFQVEQSLSSFFLRHNILCLKAIEATGSISTAKKILKDLSKFPTEWIEELSYQKLKLIAEIDTPISKRSVNRGDFEAWETLEIIEPVWEDAGLNLTDIKYGTYAKSFRKLTIQKNVYVRYGGTIFRNSALLNNDYAQNPAFDFVAGRWNHVVGSHLTLGRARVHLGHASQQCHVGEAILISSRCDDNWFHWMIETLPRLLLAEKVPTDVPILISERVPHAGVEALRIISKREVIRANEKCPVLVGRAYIPGQVIFHPDSLEFWNKNIFSIFDFPLLGEYRARILNGINTPPRSGGRKIFITRRSTHRNLINIRFIEKVLSNAFKFEIVDTAQLSFLEQIAAVKDAKSIIMIGGAGMANLLFADEGSKIAVVYPRSAAGFDIQEKIGFVAKTATKTFFGPSLSTFYFNRYSKIHANFVLTPLTWLRVLNHVLSPRIG